MNEREHSDLMRLALGSDVHWQAQTATSEGTEEIREWLLAALRRVGRDMQARQAELSATKADLGIHSTTYRNASRDFNKWKASAIRFMSMVESRLEQLPSKQSVARAVAKAARPPKSEELEKAHRHAEYMEKERQHLFRSLVSISRAVEAFEAGETSVRELAGKLDTLTVPYQGVSSKTLRTILADIKDTWVERP